MIGTPVAGDQVDGAQHGAVAAEAHGEVEARRASVASSHAVVAEAGEVGVGPRDAHLVAVGQQPRGRLAGQLGRLRPLVVQHEARRRPSARLRLGEGLVERRLGTSAAATGGRRCGRAAGTRRCRRRR